MMRTKPGNYFHSRAQQPGIAAAARRILHKPQPLRLLPARPRTTSNMIASLGMAASLLMVWAITINM